MVLVILAALGHLLAHHRTRRDLLRPSWSLVLLGIVQVGLGGWTIWSQRAPLVNTAHVVTGALVLATSLVLGLRVNRHRFPDANPLGLPTPSTRTTI